MLLQKGISKNKIPDPLLYTHYMIDEAGRENAVLMMLIVEYHYFIHQMYDSDEVDHVPTVILLGSNKQSKTINTPIGSDKIYYSILEKDMLSVTTAPMFTDLYNKGMLLRRNKVYNRRLLETNNPYRTSLVMELNSALENNDDQALQTLIELSKIPGVARPIDDFFFKTDTSNEEKSSRKRNLKETNANLSSIETAYLRICTKHTDNTTVLENLKFQSTNTESVWERVYALDNEYSPAEIYNANTLFCPAFNDETYLTPNWVKEAI